MNEKFNLWLKENGWNVKLNQTKYDWMGNQVLNKYSHDLRVKRYSSKDTV